MRREAWIGIGAAVAAASLPVGQAVAQEVVLHPKVFSPAATVVDTTETLDRVEIVVHPDLDKVPVEVDIVLTSRLEACITLPDTCDGGERIDEPLCYDKVDNDGDGLIDRGDPDCTGVQGYTLVLGTDSSFHLRGGDRGATYSGTVSDDHTQPPGLVQLPTLRYVDVINPTLNEGQEGVVGVCILSLVEFVILPPSSDSTVLKITGDLDVSGLRPGETTAPCRVDIRGPGEEGLRGMGEPVTTTVTVHGEDYPHRTKDLEIVVRIGEYPPFRRGEANQDGVVDISDVLTILGYLFLGTETPGCLDSADTDDSGTLEITDGLAVFEFLFFGTFLPPMPGSAECGPDPTEDDDLGCRNFSRC